MGSKYKLEFINITKAFPGVLALNNVSFGIKEGTIHVIMGENGAGKSTLMKIISGVYGQTSGKMLLDGKEVKFSSPRDAEKHGIGMIYQELQYFPDFTIERYLMLGKEPGRFGFINWREVSDRARKMLQEANMNYDPKTIMRRLSVSDIQLLEITKVLKTSGCNIIIMDEPTSALSNAEVDRLFKNISMLKEQGITILYISHKMDEIFKIADYITVMRDGMHINTAPASEYTQESLINMMVGRKISNVYPKEEVEIGDTVLEVKSLTSYASRLYDISFHVRKSEILGIAGLMGSGRTELVRALYGAA